LQAKYRLQLTTDDRYIAANGVTGYVVLAYLALAYRMPSIGNFPPGPAGVLFGYGANTQAIFRRAASVYIAAILNGAKPADMAVELPSSFDLVVNLKTAEALGISVPLSVQLQATEVIS
jgi:putative ABC transport system substrate-binding protein